MDEANTTPSPIARGPPIVRNLSLGAHAATVLNPPTIPAVYQAALTSTGPPMKQMGAITAPTSAEWTAQASCLAPTPDLYSMDWTSIPEPISRAMVPNMANIELPETSLRIEGEVKTAYALAAEIIMEPPK
uniref:Uncharacterized protein n=1 Tax=Cacopsylla melanoneura TaxID=428564 RepID=A0A8D8RW64_9HEMI